MVRLKGRPETTCGSADTKFQFQNGSIKSINLNFSLKQCQLFQFQNGSIKRAGYKVCAECASKFQFQNGSIKRIFLLMKS